MHLLSFSQSQDWKIVTEREINCNHPKSYSDNIEMSGRRVAGIIYYSIDEQGMLDLKRHLIFPQLRTHIKDTDSKWQIYRGYLKTDLEDDVLPHLYIKGKQLIPGKVSSLSIDGMLTIQHEASKSGISIKRILYPSTEQALFVEEWEITNRTDTIADILIGNILWDQDRYGPYGKYVLTVDCLTEEEVKLKPMESYSFRINFSARQDSDSEYIYRDEYMERLFFLDDVHDNLIFESPDSVLNTLFAFSKVRAAESIFDSKMGIVHSPGGGRYYTGVWANDQAEYSGPFFPYLGYKDGNVAALNAYKQFYKQMKTIPNHDKNLSSSFEMNGELTCCGSDRGDAAMIAYGGLHYLLAYGDRQLAQQHEPMIDWCLTYCHKKLNDEGVVCSETDEMEGRIPTGTANLSTSSLYYGALVHAIDYYQELGYPYEKVSLLQDRKTRLAQAIVDYFGANVDGLDTYKYFKEHTNLRHWICLPLVMGIHDRADATVEALFDRLWTDNGVHVEKNSSQPDISKIFWDRGTLYALRGTFIAGKTDESINKLHTFSKKRLLGDHVPYVVEAFPEGNMAHLSAESALYCRVITEGMFGILPRGFDSFDMTPRLPQDWDSMALRNVRALNMNLDMEVNRSEDKINIKVIDQLSGVVFDESVENGQTVRINLL